MLQVYPILKALIFLANIHTNVEGLQRMTSSHATKFSELEKNRTYVSIPGRFSIVMLMLAVRCERVFFLKKKTYQRKGHL